MESVFPSAGGALASAGPLPGGGRGTSGTGGADGGAVGAPGGAGDDLGPGFAGAGSVGPGFDAPVAPGGYVWWYVDAFSDDGKHGLTIIAFVGSVFSPYYAWDGRRAPENHCAINVALYGSPARWAMTMRGACALARSADSFAVGPSALHWDGNGFDIDIREVCAPWPRRLVGRVRLDVETINTRVFELESVGRHFWRPIAPLARVSVNMSQPDIQWRGHGYFDTNRGAEPLEAGFREWHWSRARLHDRARVFYDAEKRRGGHTALSLEFDSKGGLVERPAPDFVRLPQSAWRLPRVTRSAKTARVIATLEDSPFYSRSQIAHQIDGEEAVSVHESLDLDRFAKPVVQKMLPFRMPRRRGPAVKTDAGRKK
jgi:carotenoid 1,2-hydratase